MAAKAYSKMGNGGVENYLYVVGKKQTFLFGWNALYTGPQVFSCIRLAGSINPTKKGYKKAEPTIAKAVIDTHRKEIESIS